MGLPEMRAEVARRAKVAKHDPTPENLSALVDARRDYAAAKIEHSVRRIVGAAPPLTEAQRTRLAAIVTGTAA
jgi:hypothetical protein